MLTIYAQMHSPVACSFSYTVRHIFVGYRGTGCTIFIRILASHLLLFLMHQKVVLVNRKFVAPYTTRTQLDQYILPHCSTQRITFISLIQYIFQSLKFSMLPVTKFKWTEKQDKNTTPKKEWQKHARKYFTAC